MRQEIFLTSFKGLVKSGVVLSFILCCSGNIAFAFMGFSSPERSYEQEKYDEALDSYESALKKRPNDPFLEYNKAVVLYRQGEFDLAEEAFSKSAILGKKGLETIASYNAGNTKYRMGEAIEETNSAGAVSKYTEALDYYRRAMDLAPDDIDAKYNYEFLKKKIEEILSRQEEKQEQEQEQEQDQEKQQEQEQKQEKEQEKEQEQQENKNEEQQGEQPSQSDAGGQEKDDKKNPGSEDGEEDRDDPDQQEKDGEDSEKPEEGSGQQEKDSQDSDKPEKKPDQSEEDSEDSANPEEKPGDRENAKSTPPGSGGQEKTPAGMEGTNSKGGSTGSSGDDGNEDPGSMSRQEAELLLAQQEEEENRVRAQQRKDKQDSRPPVLMDW